MTSASGKTLANTDATTGPDHPFPEAPAPWQCKGEVFWFFTKVRPTKERPYASKSEFHDIEWSSAYADPQVTGEWKGGVASVILVRYKETPVGPYDEIIWTPGKFKVPPTGTSAFRITRIYVSGKETTYNGRKNWNVPKQIAHFEFTPNPEATSPDVLPYSRISVSPIDNPSKPFFVVNLKPTQFFSRARIPFNTKYLPSDTTIIHPPLPEDPNWRETGIVGTNRWSSLNPGVTGKAGLLLAKGGLEGGRFGDDVGFPDVEPWELGMWLRDFQLEFPVGEEPGAKQKKE